MASVLSLHFSWVLILGAGTGVAVYRLHQVYQAYQAQFEEHLKCGQMSKSVESWLRRGEGLTWLPGVIGIAGSFLILAALRSDPKEPPGWVERCKRFFERPSDSGSWA